MEKLYFFDETFYWGRRQVMAALGDMADIMGTCGLSYVGKANFGAAER